MPETDTEAKDHLLSNRTYDCLKLLALLILPAIGTAYVGLAAIWGLPKPQEVSDTIVVLVTFLGVVIRIGTTSYNKSQAKYDGVVEVSPDSDSARLRLDLSPENLQGRNEIVVRIDKPPPLEIVE